MKRAVFAAPSKGMRSMPDQKALVTDLPNPQQTTSSMDASLISASDMDARTWTKNASLVSGLYVPAANADAAAATCISESKLERMDFNVVLRIARHLNDGTDPGVTQLAMLCRMKYTTCRNYLDCMRIMGWITCDKYAKLTPEGCRILK